VSSHDSGAVAVSDKRYKNGIVGGVFTRAASLSVPLKWASTSANPVARCRCEPIFSSGSAGATNQSINRIYLHQVSASGIKVKDEINRAEDLPDYGLLLA